MTAADSNSAISCSYAIATVMPNSISGIISARQSLLVTTISVTVTTTSASSVASRLKSSTIRGSRW